VRFSRKQQDGSAPIFFSEFMRKHLFITTCFEKHCTRPLGFLATKNISTYDNGLRRS